MNFVGLKDYTSLKDSKLTFTTHFDSVSKYLSKKLENNENLPFNQKPICLKSKNCQLLSNMSFAKSRKNERVVNTISNKPNKLKVDMSRNKQKPKATGTNKSSEKNQRKQTEGSSRELLVNSFKLRSRMNNPLIKRKIDKSVNRMKSIFQTEVEAETNLKFSFTKCLNERLARSKGGIRNKNTTESARIKSAVKIRDVSKSLQVSKKTKPKTNLTKDHEKKTNPNGKQTKNQMMKPLSDYFLNIKIPNITSFKRDFSQMFRHVQTKQSICNSSKNDEPKLSSIEVKSHLKNGPKMRSQILEYTDLLSKKQPNNWTTSNKLKNNDEFIKEQELQKHIRFLKLSSDSKNKTKLEENGLINKKIEHFSSSNKLKKNDDSKTENNEQKGCVDKNQEFCNKKWLKKIKQNGLKSLQEQNGLDYQKNTSLKKINKNDIKNENTKNKNKNAKFEFI